MEMGIIRRSIAVALLFLSCLAVSGQTDWQTCLEALAADEETDAVTLEQMHDALSDLAEHRLNINTATYDDMKATMILNDKQISEIMKYRDRHGALRDVRELRMMGSIDRARCDLLMCVVCVGAKDVDGWVGGDSMKRWRSEVTGTVKVPLYDREGDRNGYLGYKYQHSVRYVMTRDRLKIGFMGSEDSGEPFFAGRNRAGYDFYSAFATMMDIGSWKQVTVGRYKIRTGMGLVMNTYFGFGKTALLSALLADRTMTAGYTSRREADYMQGATATLRIGRGWNMTLLASARRIDATLNGDSTIRTIVTTGYHRTPEEMDGRRDAWLSTGGMNMEWHSGGWHAGATAVAYGVSKALRPDTRQIFRRYYLSGSSFWNVSADYGYNSRHVQACGETATGSSGGMATINSVSWTPADAVEVMAVQRFYSYRYAALFAKSFSEGGQVQNESGLMAGIRWNVSRAVELTAYSDYAYFPWARYMVSRASHTWDNMAELTARSGRYTLAVRYRVKMKERDNDTKDALTDYAEHRARVRMGYETDTWSVRVEGDMTRSTLDEGSTGWMTSCMASVTAVRWLRLWANAGYFNTDDYQSRIYVYERSMLYTFTFPMYYGRGIRYAVMAEAKIGKNVAVTMKAGTTDYFDRNHVSEGLQQVNRSALTDVEGQVRIKF
jgi:hypothetical protein